VIGYGSIDTGPVTPLRNGASDHAEGRHRLLPVNGAERRPASGKPPLDDEKWPARLRELRPINVCPIVAGEKAFYQAA
jgi:hypothetical protein